MNRSQHQEQLHKQRAAAVQSHRIQPKIAPKVQPAPTQQPYTNEDIAAKRTDELNKRFEEEIAARTKPATSATSATPATPATPVATQITSVAESVTPAVIPPLINQPITPKKIAAKAPPKKPTVKRVAPKPVEESPLSDEQRQAIEAYIDLDDKIMEAKSKLKELQNQQLILQPILANALKNTPIKSGNTVLRVKTSETKEGISQKFLIRKLEESGELKNSEHAKKVIEDIYKSRVVKGVKESIERKI
jgi:hypothetical protein